MITKRCDVCQKEVDSLIELKDPFKVDRISEVCEECSDEINDLFFKIARAQHIQREKFIRRIIIKMRRKFLTPNNKHNENT